ENLIQSDQSPEKIIAFSESMRNYMRQIEQKILNGERVDYIPFLTALQKIHTGGKSMISCGVMKGTTAVGVNGDFYPCHRFVGMPGYEYGNVFDGINQIKQKTICDNLDNANTNCNRCFARYICSRGCIRDVATSDTGFKEYDEATFCTTMRELVVEYLAIYANLKLAKPEVFAQIDKKLQEVNIIEQDV
ncbi:MAG: SPASM domain-containing protein, partial [Bacteroidia bacterium]|nr:SPASM domain-containing protein [Bacteroidia bacterium]